MNNNQAINTDNTYATTSEYDYLIYDMFPVEFRKIIREAPFDVACELLHNPYTKAKYLGEVDEFYEVIEEDIAKISAEEHELAYPGLKDFKYERNY